MDNAVYEWDAAAKAYSASEETSRYSLFCREFVAGHFACINNKNVLDAGCGNGAYTHILTKNGGIVTGCDISSGMLSIAKEKFPAYSFDKADLTGELPYENNSFDIVFCHLVLMDIDPIDNALSEFYRVIRNSGIFFFSICHPAFYRAEWETADNNRIISKKVREYITPVRERQNFWGMTTHYHRPLSYYFNKTSKAGFILDEMYEPAVYEETKIPEIPLYLFAEFHKG